MLRAVRQCEALQRAHWRNPLTDAEYVLRKYGLQWIWEAGTSDDDDDRERTPAEYARKAAGAVASEQRKGWLFDWARSMGYPRRVREVMKEMDCPVMRSRHLEVWVVRCLTDAKEEKIYSLGALPDNRRRCTRGCNAEETAYHVVAACVSPEYVERHDFVVYWMLRTILESTGAKPDVRARLGYGSATLDVEYPRITGGQQAGTIKVRAGGKFMLNRPVYHNRPDIVVFTSEPKKVYVFEVAVAHLQNIREQERLKRARYAYNSEAKVLPESVETLTRGRTFVAEVSEVAGCECRFGVAVLGCFGEVVSTAELKATEELLKEVGVGGRARKACWAKASYSVALVTAKLVVRRR